MTTDVPGDEDIRQRIKDDLDTTLVVVAGAGTGKTTALVSRVVELVRTGAARMREIGAITFTEAAAAELRDRVRSALEEAAAKSPADAALAQGRSEIDEATICTLHAFAQRLLIEQAVAAGLPPGFEVLDGPADVADFEARWARFADALFDDPDAQPALVRGFVTGLQPRNLELIAWSLHNNWDRLEDRAVPARHPDPRLAGVGGAIEATSVVAALDRALGLAHWCTAEDDLLLRHVLDVAADAGRRLIAAEDDEQALLAELTFLPPLQCKNGRKEKWQTHIEEVRTACQEAEDARSSLLQTVRREVLADVVPRLAAFVIGAAEERRIEGTITFHDLLVLARRVLRGGGDAAESLRLRYSHLLIDEFQDTDPLQVELAARLTAVVEGGGLDSTRPGALFLVGDPKQSIYRFRRADIELFDRVGKQVGDRVVLRTNFRSVPGILDFVNVVFSDLFGEHSGPGQAAHHDLDGSRLGLPGAVPADDGAGANAAVATQLTLAGFDNDDAGTGGGGRRGAPARAPGPVPVVVLGGRLGTSASDVRRKAATEAAHTMHTIVGQWPVQDRLGALRSARWADIAVLIPTRSSLASLEEALEEADVPYRVEGASLLWDTEEVRDVVAVLRAVDDPADSVSVLAALRSPGLSCGDDDLVTWHRQGGRWDPRTAPPPSLSAHPVAVAMAVLDRLHRQRWWSEPSAIVAQTMIDLHSFELAVGHRRPRDHWHRLRWLSDQSRLFDDAVGGTLRAFLHWADLQARDEGYRAGLGPPDPDDDAVRIMTIHGAKGLEFPVVVLAGLERDEAAGQNPGPVLWTEDGQLEVSAGKLFQSSGYDAAKTHDQTLDALERHRLLYVAMTRARDHLVLCVHHKGRNDGPDSSPAAMLDVVCARHPGLWRRAPIDQTGLAPTLARSASPEPPAAMVETPDQWAVKLAAWQVERDALLERLRRQPVATATAIAETSAAASHEASTPRARPAVATTTDPGWPGAEEGEWRTTDTALQVGRAVHAVLAMVDLSTGCDAGGRPVADLAQGRARAQGIEDHSGTVASMVGVALSSDTVRRAAAGRYWREMYVGAPVGDAGVIEGYVDLVYEDGEDLVVVDYKTDRIGGPGALAAVASRYRLQLATYAAAIESSTQRRVSRCVLVFVGEGEPLEHVLDGEDLVAARLEAMAAAAALVS